MRNTPDLPRPTNKHPLLFLLCVLGAIAAAVGVWRFARPDETITVQNIAPLLPLRMERPAGMHPVAYEAFMRACNNARIHPFRIGQTLGNHPRSVGYHRRDGVTTLRGEIIEYSAAVDLGTWDLDPARINRFVESLAQQGFAAFYRQGAKWKGNEHIHAIYALLPMKIQLRRQVRQFLRERRSDGKPPLRWEPKMKRRWRQWKYF